MYEYVQCTWNSSFVYTFLYSCICVYIWNIISLSHKCCSAFYLGLKLSDYNILHWSQIPECTRHWCCSLLGLVAKQDWYAEGCSPEPDWGWHLWRGKHRDRHIRDVLKEVTQPYTFHQLKKCNVLHLCWFLDAASGTCNLPISWKKLPMRICISLQTVAASDHLYSAQIV